MDLGRVPRLFVYFDHDFDHEGRAPSDGPARETRVSKSQHGTKNSWILPKSGRFPVQTIDGRESALCGRLQMAQLEEREDGCLL